MTEITFLQPDGAETLLTLEPNTSIMRAAVVAGVPGIVGECGGQAMCGTCHVYISEDQGDLGPIGEDEDEMLEIVAEHRTEESRLSCQLKNLSMTALTVRVPEQQL